MAVERLERTGATGRLRTGGVDRGPNRHVPCFKTEISSPSARRMEKAAMVPTNSDVKYGITENPTGKTLPTTPRVIKPIAVLNVGIPPEGPYAIQVPVLGPGGKCYPIDTMSCRMRVAGIGLDSRAGNFFRIDLSFRTDFSE